MKKKIYLLLDCSGSMCPQKDQMNLTMQKYVSEIIPEVLSIKSEDLEIYNAVIGFSGAFDNNIRLFFDGKIEDFDNWIDLDADSFISTTPTGAAIQHVIDDLKADPNRDQMLPPLIILISDGRPNGKSPTYEEILQTTEPLYKRSIRVCIGLNCDNEAKESLKKFGRLSTKLLKAQIQEYYDLDSFNSNDICEIIKTTTFTTLCE